MYSTIKTSKEEKTSQTGGQSNEIINFITNNPKKNIGGRSNEISNWNPENKSKKARLYSETFYHSLKGLSDKEKNQIALKLCPFLSL